MSQWSFFWIFGFLSLYFSKSNMVNALPPYRMVRLDFLDDLHLVGSSRKWNSYVLTGKPEGLLISTNLPSSILSTAQNEFKKVFGNIKNFTPAFAPAFEKEFMPIPDDANEVFVEKVFAELNRGDIQHLVFENIPWEQVLFEKFSPFLKKLKNFKSLEFRQTVIDPELLGDLLFHSTTLENLSFSSCFMRHDFLKKMETSSRLKKLSLSQVGFFEDPESNSAADYIPAGLTELSIFSCYKVVASERFLKKSGIEIYLMKKLGHFVGVPWLAERKSPFPTLERLTLQEPEICLENLASYPVDKIFELAPQLSSFEFRSVYHMGWYEQNREEIDYLTFVQQYKKECCGFLIGLPRIYWEKGASSLTFETDDFFPFNSKSGPKISLAENGLFKLNKRPLDEEEAEKATKDFQKLIQKFKSVDLIRLNEENSFSLKLKEFLEKKGRKIEFISLKQETIPDYVFMTCSKRIQMGFDVFESNQKQNFAIYSPSICKQISLKYNLSEEEAKKKFEDGTVNELFKDIFRNVEDLTQYLIKELSLFLFTAEELKKAKECLGYYPVSHLGMFPYDIYSHEPLCHPEIPIEFIELFSSDFNNLPDFNLPDFTVSTKEYLLKREANIRKTLGNVAAKEITARFLHHIVIAYLFPSSCQMIPLLKVQKRAELVARAILGLEESEGRLE